MSKITRRSYKRKKIIMGVALFGAIGLVSTGFAAWVLSASANNQQPANLKVGAVSDKSMTFNNVKVFGYDTNPDSLTFGELIETNDFSFNPLASDTTGRVRFGRGEEGQDVGERLTLTVKGEVKEAQNLGSLKVSFDSIPAALTEAVTKKYVTMPACATEQNVAFTLSGEGLSKVASFEYDISFEWGETFGFMNPGEYYDEDVEGREVETSVVREKLDDLHTLLDNVQLKATFVAIPN